MELTHTDSLVEQSLDAEQIDLVRTQINARQTERIAAQKDMLVQSADLRRVISDVGALRELPVDTNYVDFDGLHTSLQSVFDFRTKPDGSYGERADAEENAKSFLEQCDESLKARIYNVAEAFGLTGDTEPAEPHVKAAVILGGGGKSPLDRTMYTKELIDSGKLSPEYVVALGSERPVDDKEIERAGSYAEGAKTEFDLMVKAAEQVFGVRVSPSDIVTWKDQGISAGVPNEVKIVAVPASDTHPSLFIISSAVATNPYVRVRRDGRTEVIMKARTDTADSLATLGWMSVPQPGDKAVAVTNAHFKPFQGAAVAGQLAAHGVDTEVVGFDPQHYGNVPKRSDELLQEMLTTADSLADAGHAASAHSEISGKETIQQRQRRVSAQRAAEMVLAASAKKVA